MERFLKSLLVALCAIAAFTSVHANDSNPCRNLLGTPAMLDGAAWDQSSGTIINTKVDTRTEVMFSVQLRNVPNANGNPIATPCYKTFSSPQFYTCTFTTPSNVSYARFYLNGLTRNVGTSVFPINPNTKYTFSMNVTGVDPTTIGGIVLSNMQLEHGSTATNYIAYNPACWEIKIATTKYNDARFDPVITNLNTAVSTIKSVVTNTINQTEAIASLQADKQTRPDSACPAGKKCLLVEDANGDPHWYEIIEKYIPSEPAEPEPVLAEP